MTEGNNFLPKNNVLWQILLIFTSEIGNMPMLGYTEMRSNVFHSKTKT